MNTYSLFTNQTPPKIRKECCQDIVGDAIKTTTLDVEFVHLGILGLRGPRRRGRVANRSGRFSPDLLFGRLELIITELASRTPSRIRAFRTQYPAGCQTPTFVRLLNLIANA